MTYVYDALKKYIQPNQTITHISSSGELENHKFLRWVPNLTEGEEDHIIAKVTDETLMRGKGVYFLTDIINPEMITHIDGNNIALYTRRLSQEIV